MWEGVKSGWGITLDDDKRILYVSDGTSKITRVDADTLEQTSQFTVRNAKGHAVPKINELEFVDDFIWANVFGKNSMIKIDPDSGYIVAKLDFKHLHDAEIKLVKAKNEYAGYDHGNNVCNGIAYNEAE